MLFQGKRLHKNVLFDFDKVRDSVTFVPVKLEHFHELVDLKELVIRDLGE